MSRKNIKYKSNWVVCDNSIFYLLKTCPNLIYCAKNPKSLKSFQIFLKITNFESYEIHTHKNCMNILQMKKLNHHINQSYD